jgi:hypothetical protein
MNAITPTPLNSVSHLLRMDPATKMDVRHVAMSIIGDAGRVAAHFSQADPFNAHAARTNLENAMLKNMLSAAEWDVIEQFREAQTGSENDTLADAVDALWGEL